MNAGSTMTSRDSHEVRHISTARQARSGRPEVQRTMRPGRDQQHRRRPAAAQPTETGRASATPASTRQRQRHHQTLRGAGDGREEHDGERRVHGGSVARGSSGAAAAACGPPRQVLVGRLRVPLGHQRVAAALADRLRDLGVRVLHVAEQPRAGRAGLDAGRLAVFLGQAARRRCGRRTSVHLVITWRSSSSSRAPYGQAQAQYLQPMHLS